MNTNRKVKIFIRSFRDYHIKYDESSVMVFYF